MNIETVNELIQSLESAGELSIREQKFLKLAKAFKQLAAENVALKAAFHPSDIPSEWTDVFGDTAVIEHDAAGDNQGHSISWSWVDNQEEVIKSVLLAVDKGIETPATDRIVAEAEARGVERAIAHLEKKFSNIGVQIMNLQWLAYSLRKGASE
ncbi:hypothetical protein [Klebsiella pneumoniae]|uniref:hypothetical protein n=1 Tax=Klebsiella pneumoniae TaxID=573 RepID=UPI0028FBEF85|nr:hypothetical protein [Klebsiella pneumoniae]MDT9789539.1 hypothetical protein [Klebsiella pneumoniae]